MNPNVTSAEKSLLEQIMPMQGKHVFTSNLGDGEIDTITRKNDLSGVYVYFHSNLHGQIKLDGEEFLSFVVEVK